MSGDGRLFSNRRNSSTPGGEPCLCMMPVVDIVHLIQSAVAPVFLLSGVGVTLGVLTNRLARIVDRGRKLEADMASHAAPSEEIHESLRVLGRRAHYINTAIALCAISALLVALVVVSLFIGELARVNLSIAIGTLFVLAMSSLTAAFVAFLVEVRLATRSLRFGAARQTSGNP
jgi:uncharacterized protein DUF2721